MCCTARQGLTELIGFTARPYHEQCSAVHLDGIAPRCDSRQPRLTSAPQVNKRDDGTGCDKALHGALRTSSRDDPPAQPRCHRRQLIAIAKGQEEERRTARVLDKMRIYAVHNCLHLPV